MLRVRFVCQKIKLHFEQLNVKRTRSLCYSALRNDRTQKPTKVHERD